MTPFGTELGLLPPPALVVEQAQGMVEHALVVAGVVHVARGDVVRELVGLDEVLAPELRRIQLQLLRRLLHDAFERPVGDLGTEAPVGALLRLVRQDGSEAIFGARDPVGAGQLRHRVPVGADPEVDVSAVIVDDVGLEAAERAVLRERHLDVVVTIGSVVVAVRHVVEAVLDVLHGTPGQLGHHRRRREGPPAREPCPEAAAGRVGDDVQLVARHLQRVGEREDQP